ncbi:GH92 family glycosyl hydrolase [uncultured Mucilaginibacter sp.]|uniref:GH92 family glycosyl hydrolase n=1 Tax=uncultured Mucilaginibacter sp. TaxID=797541 RepID=UPI0025E4C03E|nr:GH92 family glycosyl hydrolase [uncultured Mucilaginibacter sp.]
MKKVILHLFGSVLCILPYLAVAQNLVEYVQPLSGTAPSTTPSSKKHGSGTELNANTIPAVTLPFGMTQWTPETQRSENKCVPPYRYNDSKISGFRASHWLSGSCTQDYGSVTITPVGSRLNLNPEAGSIPFSHKDEITAPHYYKVNLPQRKLTTEITATTRCGMLRFTSQSADSVYFTVKPNSDRNEGFVKVDRQLGLIWGYNPVHRIYQGWGEKAGFNGYFVIQFNQPLSTAGLFTNDKVTPGDSIKNQPEAGAYVGFKLKAGEHLQMRVGTSFTSFAGALLNLESEIKDWNFERLIKSNFTVWQNALSRVSVSDNNEKHKRIFYTALYHAMQQPRCFNDVNGLYPRFGSYYKNEKFSNGNYYDDFSMWDTYRAQMPLFEILKPDFVNDCVKSMILKGEQGGWLPIFPCWNSYTAAMIGDHVTAFIASAYIRGIRNYDVKKAYALMRRNAFEVPTTQEYRDGKGRRAIQSYLKYGFIPVEDSVPEAFHKKEQVSRTLEYAFDDYALAMVAAGLNLNKDKNGLLNRSKNYLNVLDGNSKMVRARKRDGSWYSPYNPKNKEFYITEGTPQQYTFYVPHDINGLAKAMGGQAVLEQQLDTLFRTGEYWHGNEPGQQTPYIYNFTASPWKTQYWVRNTMDEEYSDGPGGLSGNDDAGQVSAWYVFSAMGFYPLNPASNQYLITAPIFNSYKVQLGQNKVFEVKCHKNTSDAFYIDHVSYNGKPYNFNYLTHQTITQGGKLDIYLRSTPNKMWGTAKRYKPASLTR